MGHIGTHTYAHIHTLSQSERSDSVIRRVSLGANQLRWYQQRDVAVVTGVVSGVQSDLAAGSCSNEHGAPNGEAHGVPKA